MSKRPSKKITHINFRFNRVVRTFSSEEYFIFRDNLDIDSSDNVGSFNLHIDGKIYHGVLILKIKLKSSELEKLLTQLETQIIEYPDELREDFILTVYQAKEIGSYSDYITEERRSYESATRGDLENISSTIIKVLGRHQNVRGKLNEHALVEYFQVLGYQAELASSELDQQKIDVVATNSTEIIYAQAKLGEISQQEMQKLLDSVAKLPDDSSRSKIAAIVAHSFPPQSELFRLQLEREKGIPLLCIQQYQMLKTVPQYKRMLDK